MHECLQGYKVLDQCLVLRPGKHPPDRYLLKKDLQYDAREKCMSGVIPASVTAQPAVSATPATDESAAKLKQITADSKDALQLSAASRVPGDVIK